MVDDKHFRAELISKTPSAQTREEALEHVRLRRQQWMRECTIDTDFAEPERAPIAESLQRARETFKPSRPPSPHDQPPPRGTPQLRVLDGGKDGDNS